MRLIVLPDETAVALAAAEETLNGLKSGIAARGAAHIAMTGGSGAVPLYRALAREPARSEVDWRDVYFWWGDDRFVPLDHPESNAGAAYRILFDVSVLLGNSGTGAVGTDIAAGNFPGLEIDPDKVHPIDSEGAIAASGGPEWAAAAYANDIGSLVPAGQDGLPLFDVFLGGVGPDGHCLSVFPNSPALDPGSPLVMGIPAPTHVEPHLPRVTLAPRVMGAAGVVIMVVTGASKADVLATILAGERDVARWPAQTAILDNAVWILDEPAAANLPADLRPA
jgi:6-phosphogluconolactonase